MELFKCHDLKKFFIFISLDKFLFEFYLWKKKHNSGQITDKVIRFGKTNYPILYCKRRKKKLTGYHTAYRFLLILFLFCLLPTEMYKETNVVCHSKNWTKKNDQNFHSCPQKTIFLFMIFTLQKLKQKKFCFFFFSKRSLVIAFENDLVLCRTTLKWITYWEWARSFFWYEVLISMGNRQISKIFEKMKSLKCFRCFSHTPKYKKT